MYDLELVSCGLTHLYKQGLESVLRLQQYVLPVLPLSKAENAVRSKHNMTTTTVTYTTLLLFAKNKG
jgi:hypothetical protein